MFFASLRWHLHSINVIKLPIPTMQVTLYHIWKAPNKDITRRNLTGEIPPQSLSITLPFSSRTILPSIKIHHHKESNPTLDSMISYEARIHTLSVYLCPAITVIPVLLTVHLSVATVPLQHFTQDTQVLSMAITSQNSRYCPFLRMGKARI